MREDELIISKLVFGNFTIFHIPFQKPQINCPTITGNTVMIRVFLPGFLVKP